MVRLNADTVTDSNRRTAAGRANDDLPAARAAAVHVSDEELLVQIGVGDREAFAALYDRYSSRVYGLLMRICRDAKLAEDTLQEAFLYVWSSRGRFDRQRGAPLAWLLLIARSRALDALRRTARHAPSGEEARQRAGGDGGLEQLAVDEDAQRARRALSALPAEQRSAITLAFYDGLTHEEISRRENIPLGTIKTRIRLGMHKLRELLGADAA